MDDELDFEGESEVVDGSEELDFEGESEVLDDGVEYAGRNLRNAKAPVGKFTSYLMGLSDWGTQGFSDELSGVVGAGIEGVKALAKGENPIAAAGKGYTETRDYSRDLSDRAWEQNPGAYGAGAATSLIGPGGVAKAVTKTPQMVARAIPGLAAKAAPQVATQTATKAAPGLAKRMATGAARGGVAGVGFSEADTVEGVVKDGLKTAVVGGALPAAGDLVKGGAKLTGKAAWKAQKAMTGLNEGHLKRIAERGDRINTAPTPDQLGELARKRIEALSKKASAASREAIEDLAAAQPNASVNVTKLKRAVEAELKANPGSAQASGLRETLQRITSRDVNAQEAQKLRALAGQTQDKTAKRALNKRAANLEKEAKLKPLDTRDVVDTLQKYSDFRGNSIINDPALKRNARELTFFRRQQHMLNDSLKHQFPQYREGMKAASDANRLLERSQKVLGKVGDDLNDGATGERLQRMALKEGRDIKKLNKLDEIDKALGTPQAERLREYALDAASKQVLDKAVTQGSRNVLAGAIAFGRIGAIIAYGMDTYGRSGAIKLIQAGSKHGPKVRSLAAQVENLIKAGTDPRVIAQIVATKTKNDPELARGMESLADEIEAQGR